MRRLLLVLMWIFACNESLFSQTDMVLSLDGGGDFVEVPDSTSLNIGGTAGFTVEFWFRTGDRLTANLINKSTLQQTYVGFTQGTGWAVDINPPREDGSSSTGWISVERSDGHGGWGPARCCFNPNQWHHFAWTMAREAVIDHLYPLTDSLYVDGVLIGAGRSSSSRERDFFNTIGTSLGIGAVPSDIDGLRYFRGEIDEVRLWKVARTQSQIQAAMSDTLGPAYYATADSGLIAYYRFDRLENLGIGDDGLADDVRDMSVHGNHGDLKGDATVVLSDSPVKVEDPPSPIPAEFALGQNYPNPFNPETAITYQIAQPGQVILRIYNLLGQTVTTLVNERMAQGLHSVSWDGTNAAGVAVTSGVYLYRLASGEFVETRKLTLLR